MRAILLLWLLSTSMGFGLPITGPELIDPSMEEISRCVPQPDQEAIYEAILNLPSVAKVTKELYKNVTGCFSKNCKMLVKYLEKINKKQLLKYTNITPNISEKDRKVVVSNLKDPETGFSNYLKILNDIDSHLAGHVGELRDMLKQGKKLTVIDLIKSVDFIQKDALELQEFLQMLTYLDLAYEKIPGYSAILDGMQHQLSFKIIHLVNKLSGLTEVLRTGNLSQIDKGDCSGEQIAHALGVTSKKIAAIEAE
jgi:hypothetical protein